jgi:predicted O-linked N-acetylglucosamine transferase (SPINDLY family)
VALRTHFLDRKAEALAAVLTKLGRYEEAEASAGKALEAREGYAEAHRHLAEALRRQGKLSGAIQHGQRAVELREGYSEAWVTLASAWSDLGRASEAIECHRKVVELRPHSPQAHSNLLYVLHYDEQVSPRAIYQEHLRWAEKHAAPLYVHARPHENDRDPQRRLRVGYVSVNFRSHPVSRFFQPLQTNHDPDQVETFCYDCSADPADEVTGRLRGHAHHWREARQLSDEALAEMIRADRIDVLVDLMGHIGGNRLLVFARKPAPVQVSYIGYPDTTGLATMDARFTDSLHDPEGECQAHHSETLVRLDPCAWCYQPDEDSPPVHELPALNNGYVTFAALNKPVKASATIVRLWAEVLDAVPGSVLKVLGEDDPMAAEWFGRHGIAPDRVTFLPRVPRSRYLAEHRSSDIALDTFPYNGHTTTCDALWMGVPVVSLAGRTHVSRAGLSVLSAVGLGELAAGIPGEYVRSAVALASDLPKLAALRRELRPRVQRSPMRHGTGLAKRVDQAYQGLWRQWCSGRACHGAT